MASNTSAPAGNDSNHHRNGSDPVGRTPDPGLYAPPLHNSAEPDDSLRAIIDRLMMPPDFLYSEGGQEVTLNVTWAVGVVGRERFEATPLGRRLSLRQDDELRTQGVEWGLSEEIADWLRYGEDTLVLPTSHFV
ncbi:hypothetical protein E8E12_002005 [Didymella heteroderae]|uniref:Uncharacterized protein n=1 Tax=Didymella heteroderae TaxID=1769908 RepID=A0A9P4WW71_9PLEO|nr:hypothetical protein E8E12_002005 [Didymella heteroderae]